MTSQFAVLVGDHEGDPSLLRDYAESISGRSSLAVPPTDFADQSYQPGSQTTRADRNVSFAFPTDANEPIRGHVRSRSNMSFNNNVPTPRFSVRADQFEELDAQSINNNSNSTNAPPLSNKTMIVSSIMLVLLFIISRLNLIDWSTGWSIDGHGELTINGHYYSPFCSREVHSLMSPRSSGSAMSMISRFVLQSVHMTCLSTMVVLDSAPRIAVITIGLSLFAMILLMLRDQTIHPTMKGKVILQWIGQSVLLGPIAVKRYRAIVTSNKDSKQS